MTLSINWPPAVRNRSLLAPSSCESCRLGASRSERPLRCRSAPLRLRKLPQRLFRRLVFLVERIPQSADIPRLDPQSPADLFQGSSIVDVVHAETFVVTGAVTLP